MEYYLTEEDIVKYRENYDKVNYRSFTKKEWEVIKELIGDRKTQQGSYQARMLETHMTSANFTEEEKEEVRKKLYE